MLMPRKVKHRKQTRGRLKGVSKGGNALAFGEYGIQALEPGWITAFPDKPVTQKPAETRMGSGKGNPERWVAVVRPGRILFELSYPNQEVAKEALDRAI